MVGLVESYLTPFALALKAAPTQIGFLTSIPNLVASIAQTQSERLRVFAKGPKNCFMWMIQGQALSLFGLAVLPFLFPQRSVSIIIGLTLFYTGFGALSMPQWASLISQYLPMVRRSGYFGWRNRIMGFIVLAGSLISGLTLYLLKDSLKSRGFICIFVLGGICRLISVFFARRFHEPKRFRVAPAADEQVAAKWISPSLKKFFVLFGGMSFAANLAGPFYAVYVLKDLKFGYLSYMMLSIALSFTTFYFTPLWGKLADRFGNLKVITLNAWYLPIIPILWLFSPNAIYLFIIQFVSGVAWGGYSLCTTNFVYDAVPPSRRVYAMARFNMISGLCACFGAFLGGLLLGVLPPLGGHRFYSLLIVTAVARFLTVRFLLPKVREVRPVEPISNLGLFYGFLGAKPLPVLVQKKTSSDLLGNDGKLTR